MKVFHVEVMEWNTSETQENRACLKYLCEILTVFQLVMKNMSYKFLQEGLFLKERNLPLHPP